jgi:hypothetical protein
MNTTTVVNLQFSQLWKSRIHFTQKYIFIFIYTSFLLWYRMMLDGFQERTLALHKIRR